MRYIFAVTTGRSGTELLANAINACLGAAAEHEPRPVMHGRTMRYLMHGLPGRRAIGLMKAISVWRSAQRLGVRTYGDISHVFAKYGHLIVPWLGQERCVVVYLEREPKAVVASLLALGSIPRFTGVGQHWIGNPDWPKALLRFTPRDQYEAVAWHVVETRLRREFIAKAAPRSQQVYLPFDTLTSSDRMAAWLATIGLEPGPRFSPLYERKVNPKTHQKRFPVDVKRIEASLAYCESLVTS
jgi:hypothetical protein